MSYKPFLIAPLRTGLELGMPSWLAPKDAFLKVENAFLQRGVLRKRPGYSLFGHLYHDRLANGGFETGSFSPWTYWSSSPWNGTFSVSDLDPKLGIYHANINIITNGDDWNWANLLQENLTFKEGYRYRVRFWAKASASTSINIAIYRISDWENICPQKLVTLSTIYEEYVYEFTAGISANGNGALYIQFGLSGPNKSVQIDDAHLEEVPELPVMGLWNYSVTGGIQELLAFDTKRAFVYRDLSKRFEDIAGEDIFTGNESNFVWLTNFLDMAFITNGVDRIKIYDGLSISNFDIDYDGDSQNEVDTCSYIMVYKDRLVLFATREDGTLYPNRARWCMPGNYNQWRAQDWLDAPTSEWITGVAFLRNDLLVFFERSIWKLAYTGDSRMAFKWVRIAAQEGCVAGQSIVDFADEIIGMGPTQLWGTDGMEAYSVSARLPNFILDVNQERLSLAYAGVDEPNRLVFLSYPEAGYEYNSKTLVLNYDELSWSYFDTSFHCYGYFNVEAPDVTWDEVEETWDEMERVWDDRTRQAGYPLNIMGDTKSTVWQFGYVNDDDGKPIRFELVSIWMNPFVEDGRMARLGWLDILVKRDPMIEMKVDLCVDYDTAPYQSVLVNADDGTTNDKVWVRVYSGAVGKFHQFRLYNIGVNQTLEIEAICPYFAPAGRMFK